MKDISPRRRKRVQHVHPMVADMAHTIVMKAFDETMRNDLVWHTFKGQNSGKTTKQLEAIFLERYWGKAVLEARAALAKMLIPANAPWLTDEDRKNVHEALVLDASLKMGRKTPMFALN